jgi:LysR family transcriptional regulator, glycine cleavage system transcriptional activator
MAATIGQLAAGWRDTRAHPLFQVFNMRDRLPPLFCLQAFEAAARTGNFSRAAIELHLTPGAVSRQVRQLEDWIEQTLFERLGTGLRLTPEGQELSARLGDPLAALHRALAPPPGSSRPTLKIATLGSLARAWLVPRLVRFVACEPYVRLVVQTDYAVVKPAPRVPVVALRYAARGAAGTELLFEDRLLAVAAPAVAARAGSNAARWPAESVLGAAGADDVLHWIEQAGAKLPEGPTFNDAAVLLDAAAAGLGIAVARLSIAWQSLESKALVMAHPLVLPSSKSNLLIVRDDSVALPAVQAFTAWVRAQAAQTSQQISAFDSLHHPLRVATR